MPATNTLPVSTLRAHSAGDFYTPALDADGMLNLKAESGALLVGSRGNPYQFKTESAAAAWLKINLVRFKYSEAPSTQANIDKLTESYAKHGAVEVLAELQAIADYQAGAWQVIDETSGGNVILDGGNAGSE